MALTMGVDMTDMRRRTNATKSIIANGVAGRNMIEDQGRRWRIGSRQREDLKEVVVEAMTKRAQVVLRR